MVNCSMQYNYKGKIYGNNKEVCNDKTEDTKNRQ